MPNVLISRTITASTPEAVFAQLRDIEKLPQRSSMVRSVEMTTATDGSINSEWEVLFRGGIMRWTEADDFDDRHLRYGFRQLHGDLASFEGYWQVSGAGNNVLVEVYTEFDLGMPSLAEMLNPVAARALEDAMDELLTALTESRRTA
ncbi:type II toxin-antitoxin system RatA family toxin [Rhodococcus daqingensis]|uniref:Type II toxin-antitoxin system RatA family toxin n=1 Tax=Rhodococcus daqingensis TaxID=2479363 RepID=A0ABW2RWR8_9NOCA